MKKSVLQAIREKASAVRGEIETSNAYSDLRIMIGGAFVIIFAFFLMGGFR